MPGPAFACPFIARYVRNDPTESGRQRRLTASVTTPENRARYVLDTYFRDVGSLPAADAEELLRKLIADAIRKAVTEDRDALRERMACDTQEPCAFESVCSNHKALAGAILGGIVDVDAA